MSRNPHVLGHQPIETGLTPTPPSGGSSVQKPETIISRDAEILSLRARVTELEGALIPFANAAEDLDETHPDHGEIWEAPAAMNIAAGDLRRVRAALHPPTPEESVP